MVVVVLIAAALLAALLLLNRRVFDVAALMLRVDVLAFGGGFASVPLMLHWVAEVNQWMSTRSFMDGIAMGQVTPGPIVITATFVGYHVAGITGAVAATISVFFPSFVLLVLVVPRFDRLKHSRLFQKAMRGILASFIGLLLSATVRFAMAASWSPASVAISCLALTALMFDVGVAWVVLPGAALSALLLR
jgi:chromate transporter